ncbi:MAG: hypothetical protein ABL982_15400, partial [Vicinamibacterales bacterium]
YSRRTGASGWIDHELEIDDGRAWQAPDRPSVKQRERNDGTRDDGAVRDVIAEQRESGQQG